MVRPRKENVGRPRKEEAGKKDLEILKRLGLKGPLNRHQISREGSRIVISYPTVWRRLEADKDSLLNKGYVSKATEPGTYALTDRGLIRLLSQYSENLGSQISQIAERWAPSLPTLHPLLSKWSYLKQRGLETEAIGIVRTYGPLADTLPHVKLEDEQNRLDQTLKVVISTYLFGALGPERALAWCKAIRDDPELRSWMILDLNEETNFINALVGFFKQLLQTIESPDEPGLDDIKSITKNVEYTTTLAMLHAVTALSILIMVHMTTVHPDSTLIRQDVKQH